MHSKKRKFSELRNETLQTIKKLKTSFGFAPGMRWKEVRFFGKGGFASVSLLKDVTSGFLCARKTVKIDRLQRRLEEVDIHRKLKHNTVVAFLGENRDTENLYIFLAYVNGSTLGQNRHQRNVRKEGDDLKIGDFGLAGEFVKGEYLAKSCGTSVYIAPEVFTGRYLGEPNDVWSCGVVLFRLVTGQNPRKVPVTNKDTDFGSSNACKPTRGPLVVCEPQVENPWALKHESLVGGGVKDESRVPDGILAAGAEEPAGMASPFRASGSQTREKVPGGGDASMGQLLGEVILC
ncbi:serine/threonine-protein kinase PLK3-like [Oratosquilla oratoria]|uniref:serine/threonine-protein kinase PLK3-like n=1 Tax=Oratosquilla oratoria TaxID=337810 RepID=UPI003F764646